jgi:hypothetical protein
MLDKPSAPRARGRDRAARCPDPHPSCTPLPLPTSLAAGRRPRAEAERTAPDLRFLLSSPRTFRIRKPSQLTLTLAGSAVAVAAIASGTVATAQAGPAGGPGAPHSADALAGSAAAVGRADATQAGRAAGTQAGRDAGTQAGRDAGTQAARAAGIQAAQAGQPAATQAGQPAATQASRAAGRQASSAAPPGVSRPGRSGAALFTNAAASLPATPRRIARGMMPRFGWSVGGQFRYLNWLWMRESSWNRHAANPYSGAYGIPQAIPGSKMASAGPNWRSNAATQIRWGLRYIRGRYGSPRSAWSHEIVYGWY